MRALLPAFVLGLCVWAAACAKPPKPDPLEAAVARGHAVAQRTCARCHAVETVGESPDRRAPAFRVLTGQFVPLTLQRKLTEIAETGHYDMPPVSVHGDDVADLAAYLNSFGDDWRRDDRPDRRP
jgi:cytochrome c